MSNDFLSKDYKGDELRQVWASEYKTMKWAMFMAGLGTGLLFGFITSFIVWLIIGVSLEQ